MYELLYSYQYNLLSYHDTLGSALYSINTNVSHSYRIEGKFWKETFSEINRISAFQKQDFGTARYFGNIQKYFPLKLLYSN